METATTPPETDREVAGVQYLSKRPAKKSELRGALERILGVSATCWDGEGIIEQLKHFGLEVADPQGQPLFLDDLTEIFRAKGLRLALTTTGVRRWTLMLFSAHPARTDTPDGALAKLFREDPNLELGLVAERGGIKLTIVNTKGA